MISRIGIPGKLLPLRRDAQTQADGARPTGLGNIHAPKRMKISSRAMATWQNTLCSAAPPSRCSRSSTSAREGRPFCTAKAHICTQLFRDAASPKPHSTTHQHAGKNPRVQRGMRAPNSNVCIGGHVDSCTSGGLAVSQVRLPFLFRSRMHDHLSAWAARRSRLRRWHCASSECLHTASAAAA